MESKPRFRTSTPEGTEGCNISHSSEKKWGTELLKVLPKDWSVHFDWVQLMLDADVKYFIEEDLKTVYVGYNQNLHIWFPSLIREVEEKMKKEATVK